MLKTIAEGRDEPVVPSVVSVWRGADLQEREIWDLMGVSFVGHPNLKRLVTWEGFPGHPLRKDFHPGAPHMTLRTDLMTINIGPQHPSTHGVFRLRVTFDGEVIEEIEPVIGYLHRGTEKLAEERNYVQIITLTDRMDYVASMTNNQAYCLTVEKLLGVEPPPRGKVPASDYSRVAAHRQPPHRHRFLPAGLGGIGHASHVLLPRAGTHTRPV